MSNGSSPEALGLAEVVYFIERHFKCRHSNRGDLKEQQSNHKGPSPWGTMDNMGANQNTVKGFISLLVAILFLFFFFFSVKSLTISSYTFAFRSCSISTLNLRTIKSSISILQSIRMSTCISMYGYVCFMGFTNPLFFGKERQQKNYERLP